jgi:hypothetical protein
LPYPQLHVLTFFCCCNLHFYLHNKVSSLLHVMIMAPACIYVGWCSLPIMTRLLHVGNHCCHITH